MADSQYPPRAVRAKTNEVVEYHRDAEQPGRPLYLLIPGGLIALASLALILWVLYAALFAESLDSVRATIFLLLLAPVYIGGVFMFSYGYELYDIPKAIRLTAIIVIVSLAAVIIVAVLFALLGSSSKSSDSSSKSSAGKSSSSNTSASTASSGGRSRGGGGLFVDLSGAGGGTHTVTREVVHEVPVMPPAPQPIACPFCGSSYLAAENHFACPNCGAATPQNLIPPDAGGAAQARDS